MVSPNEKLANALTVLSDLQGGGQHVFRSGQFPRGHRERLVRNGHLRPVMKGWLMLSHPDAPAHDTTAWYASCWEFCGRYCTHRFGDRWHLSPELSLRLHAEDTSVPRQVVVHAQGGRNNALRLPFETSLFDLRAAAAPEPADVCGWQGLRVWTVDAALVQVPAGFFRDCPVEARTSLAGVRQVGGIVRRLLAGSRSTVAGRLAGAFRHVGRAAFADEIRHAMRNTEHDSFRESNPFAAGAEGDGDAVVAVRGFEAPIAGRLRALWAGLRGPVLSVLPGPPGLPSGDAARRRYLDSVTAAYLDDAYHSLSIEGYRVTPELIERVRSGTWNPEAVADDRGQRDALAARGYWQAFQAVRASIDEILGGVDPSTAFRVAHGRWFFEMFQPLAGSGLYEAADLAGYRNRPVFLRGSRHVPPRVEVVVQGHGNAVRPVGGGARAGRARGAGALAVRVHPPLSGRQRTHGPVRDEHDAGVGGIRLGHDQGGGPAGVHGCPRGGERGSGHRALRGVRRTVRGVRVRRAARAAYVGRLLRARRHLRG